MEAEQLDLLIQRRAVRERTLDARFAAFHQQHPRVYVELVKLAREARRRGKTRIGIGQLWEVMRWQMDLEIEDAEGFRLNNSFRSRYARLLMAREPDLADIFETRTLTSKDAGG